MNKHSKPMVLVVDDQSANVQLLGQILDAAGYHVTPALNGVEALARAKAAKPDLVLLDMRMPEMDGVEVCQRLHQITGLEDTPVIFVTGVTDREQLPKAFNAGAVDYITKPFVAEELLARVKTHVELKRARDHLSNMLKERDDITDVVAHDLKNPLTCVSFAAQMLARNDADAERRAELIHDIVSCSDDALKFIHRYLTMNAEGEYRRHFTAETVDLHALTREAVRYQRSSAQIRDIQIVVEGVTTPIHSDPMATRQVLQNLLSNAIRYSPPGEQIIVQIGGGRGGFGRCLVLDRGPGISEADQKKLFQRFVRLAAARETEYSTGLGLAIAKHDVTQMGGHLWYEVREGGGSVFGIELPQRAVDADAPA